MSSSNRYQSRLFNLVSRQSRRLSDRVALNLRQAKVAVSWSAQILVYPVYALFQTTRLVSKQIGQTIERVLPRLRATEARSTASSAEPITSAAQAVLTADTPILRSLSALQSFVTPLQLNLLAALPVADLLTNNSHLTAGEADTALAIAESAGLTVLGLEAGEISAAQSATIQSDRICGIASQLSDRRLVLTTLQNRILDILTAQQQTQLQQRIVWELAGYWRSQRSLSQQRLLLPLSPHKPHLLPPVRLVHRLMAWVQTSPVAIATNLFGEAELMQIAATTSLGEPATLRLKDASSVQASDSSAAALSQQKRSWLPKGISAIPSSDELRALRQWLNQALHVLRPESASPESASPQSIFLDEKPDSADNCQNSLGSVVPDVVPDIVLNEQAVPTKPNLRSQQHWLGRALLALLTPGELVSMSPAISSETSQQAQSTQQITSQTVQSQTVQSQTAPGQTILAADLAAASAASLPKSQWFHQALQALMVPPEPTLTEKAAAKTALVLTHPSTLVTRQTARSPEIYPENQLSSTQRRDRPSEPQQLLVNGVQAEGAIAESALANSDSLPVLVTQTSPTAIPSWIDTEVTLVGYVKHPLEQLLGWLDAGMVWLEKVGTTIWKWLHRST